MSEKIIATTLIVLGAAMIFGPWVDLFLSAVQF